MLKGEVDLRQKVISRTDYRGWDKAKVCQQHKPQTGERDVLTTISRVYIALWQSGDMGEKCNKKVVNFRN